MFTFKRFIGSITGIAMLSSMFLPAALANHIGQNTALAAVTSATQAFDPTRGQTASVNYSVTSGTAQELTVRIYLVQGSCNPTPQTLRGTIDGPANRGVGNYTATWSGKNLAGQSWAPGLYCYRLTWSNPPANATGIITGFITLTEPGANVGGGDAGAGAGAGAGDAGAGNQPQNQPAGPAPAVPSITHWLSDQDGIYFPLTDPALVINYNVNTRFPNGLNVTVKDQNNIIRKTFYPVSNFPVEVGQYSKTWDGRFDNGSLASAGFYRYVFSSSGQEITAGQIEVRFAQASPPPAPAPAPAPAPVPAPAPAPAVAPVITDFGPTPQTFDPFSANPLLNQTTFRYDLSQTSWVDLTILQNNVTVRRLVKSNAPYTAYNRLAGQKQEAWNGTNDVGQKLPYGNYTYCIEARNNNGFAQTRCGTISLEKLDLPNIDVSDVSVSKNPFTADTESITVRFTVNRASDIYLKISRAWNGQGVRAFSFSVPAAGTYERIWDGKDENGFLVSADVFSVTVQAKANNLTDEAGTFVQVNRLPFPPPPPPPPSPPFLDITNVFANPNPFTADNQNTYLNFTLNYSASVTVRINRTSDGLQVKEMSGNFGVGQNQFIWNGTDYNNVLVPGAPYTFTLFASNSTYGNDSASASVTVNRCSFPGCPPFQPALDVSLDVSPSAFNADQQVTYVKFSLNQDATVNVTVTRWSDGVFIRNLVNNIWYPAGTHQVLWNGTGANGQILPEAVYSVRIDATNPNYGADYAAQNVTITRGVFQPSTVITDFGPVPNPFNPQLLGQVTNIDFTVNKPVTIQYVRVYRSSDNLLLRELPVFALSDTSFRAQWDGRVANQFVSHGTYLYTISVSSQGQIYQKSGSVTISAGHGDPLPPVGKCAGFNDVKSNNYLCEAIKFVQSRGIFVGYPDGSIGLDKVIQRAEFLAVMQKAFQFPLQPYDPYFDGPLGYKDLENSLNEWFMPYIKTFSSLELMVGYPDGRMRPERTMNTAELFLVFLKAAKKSPLKVAHFKLDKKVPYPPFIDTPILTETLWYLKYAFFAKLNNLVLTDRFHPERGITRGQVIELIWNTHRKGLITYPAPLVAGSY